MLFTGAGKECYKKEAKYRPTPNIGWNIAQGGYVGNNLNRRLSDATKKKISEATKGRPSWCKGKTGIFSQEALHQLREATKQRVQGKDNPMFNKKHTDAAKKKIREANTGLPGLKGAANPAAKSVICLDTGKTYNTITEGAAVLGVSLALLSQHLGGKTKSCKGTVWEYINGPTAKYKEKPRVLPLHAKKVLCVETGETFTSISAAARSFNVCNSSITKAISKKTKCANLHWEFYKNTHTTKIY